MINSLRLALLWSLRFNS